MATPSILYQNLFREGTLSASSTQAGYNVNYLCDYKTYTFWKASASGAQYIEVDFASAKTLNALAIVNHNLHSSEAMLTLQGYINNAWVDLDLEFTASSDNVLYREFSPATVTKLKLIIVSSSQPVKIALLFAGQAISFPYPPEAPYIPISQSFESRVEVSKTGHTLGADLRMKPFTISARFTELSLSFLTNYLDPFVSSHVMKPFVWSYMGSYLVRFSSSWRYEKPQSLSIRAESLSLEMEGTIR